MASRGALAAVAAVAVVAAVLAASYLGWPGTARDPVSRTPPAPPRETAAATPAPPPPTPRSAPDAAVPATPAESGSTADAGDEAARVAAAMAHLERRTLALPLPGVEAGAALRDTFDDARGGRRHAALDVAAPRGTPVHAVDDGTVAKLFTSVPGGLTVYQFDPSGRLAYYYAHLDGYATGLREGQPLRRCDVIGYVGSTGNAAPDAPHLHLAVFALGAERQWWKGVALNPHPALARSATVRCAER